ncbi:inositol 5-phosphatase 4, variant 3 [Capsaspora owczarzaki ATCC 30864]|uniref:Inositol 5-phosphatase 4, variant 2 n=1 Tax=Capsaspora owczarzaki (strain ATCC 30864) TaxID=595528 RepID=A0A0D2WJA6_CAPO3|nr:inositol 5-phosphatase 4, variant 2 [Capsaspora owczarzaki ATCC 30864]KJE90080.1 inositol 5-phosphatase 4, variant 3 [Capsaspora owczarzaki ATCC 30864]
MSLLKKNQLDINLALPIFPEVEVTLLDSNPNAKKAKTGLLKLTWAGESDTEEVVFEVALGEYVQQFVQEFKAAKAVAVNEGQVTAGATHAWISNYINKQPISIVATPEMTPVENYFRQLNNVQNIDAPENLMDTYMARSAFEYNPQTLKSVKEEWIAKQLEIKKSEFTEPRTLTLLCGSWNVNGRTPKENLAPWLIPNEHPELPDVYAVGFQELDLSAEAFVFNESNREAMWCAMIEDCINLDKVYTKVKSKQLVGMLLCVYVKTVHIPHIRNVQAVVTGTGIMGMMGNKGGVAIRFRLFDTDLCFVNSHLASDSGRCDRRNQDYQEVVKRTLFTMPNGPPFTIFDHDLVFWVGDLNYRIPLPDSEVKSLVKARDYQKLLKYDELTVERNAKHVFVGFEEGPIDFYPTYKFDVGTDTFDSSEKQRTPAWCDRVLWKGAGVKQRTYTGHMVFRTSDHKPVSSLVDFAVQVVQPKRFAEVRQQIVREMDKMENECRPDAVISTNLAKFPDVKFMTRYTQSIVIENSGQVILQFRFIPKLDEKKFCKPWLRINPPVGMIVPGEKATVELMLMVDATTAASLNTGEERLEDILILHLENGKDYFVSITGNFLRTCFCTPLVTLVNTLRPVRDLTQPAAASSSSDRRTKSQPPQPNLIDFGESASTPAAPTSKPEEPKKLHIPKELWRMVDFLFTYGLDEDNLFATSGNEQSMELIRECLDTGLPFETMPDAVHSISECLIRFLEALPDPVIPFVHYQRCLDSNSNYTLCKQVSCCERGFLFFFFFCSRGCYYCVGLTQRFVCWWLLPQVLTQLPSEHYNLFVYLMAFLREVLSHAVTNGLSAEKLALLFSAVLLRPGPDKTRDAASTKKASNFIYHFLLNDEEPQFAS